MKLDSPTSIGLLKHSRLLENIVMSPIGNKFKDLELGLMSERRMTHDELVVCKKSSKII